MGSERKWSVEMLREEQKEENEEVLSEGPEELGFSVTEDHEAEEGGQGSTALIAACHENMAEVRARWLAGAAV